MNKENIKSILKRKPLIRSIFFLGIPVGSIATFITGDILLIPAAIVLSIVFEIVLMNKNQSQSSEE